MADRTPEELLDEFIDRDMAGEQPDPVSYLEQAGPRRAELVELLDAYLEWAPGDAFDPDAYRGSLAEITVDRFYRSHAGVSGRWPTVLPALRERARIKREELGERLAEALGIGEERSRVVEYLHAMEQGALPASGVSARVLEALGSVLGVDASMLRKLGSASGAGSGLTSEAAVFTRKASAPEEGADAPPPEVARGAPDASEWDEVDQLFRGG